MSFINFSPTLSLFTGLVQFPKNMKCSTYLNIKQFKMKKRQQSRSSVVSKKLSSDVNRGRIYLSLVWHIPCSLVPYLLPTFISSKGRRGNNPEEAERRSAFSRKLTSDVKNGAKRSIVGHLLPLTTHTFLCKAKAKLLWSGTKISISLKLSLFFILKATFLSSASLFSMSSSSILKKC